MNAGRERDAESVFVETAGARVHAAVSGPPAGLPLLLSSGLGGAWFEWGAVAEALSEHYRVISFDRPGLGLSPPGRRPPSLRGEVELLAGLAGWAGPPVTVVAHSMAGFHAEALARVHPGLVSGLVLVDPSCEPRPMRAARLSPIAFPATRLLGHALEITRIARLAGPQGRRIMLHPTSRVGEQAPQELVRDVYGRGGVLGTAVAENCAYREMANDLLALRARRPFPQIPLVVLTALGDVRGAAKRARWDAGHRALAAMSPRGHQIVLTDSLHMIQYDRPDAVIRAVAEVTGTAAA